MYEAVGDMDLQRLISSVWGIKVAVGGWVVVFMEKVRHAAPFLAGMSATGYCHGGPCGPGRLDAADWGKTGNLWYVTFFMLCKSNDLRCSYSRF